jgi:hypothetical protein
MSKQSAKSNKHEIHPKNFNHAFLPKLEFESYRNDIKRVMIIQIMKMIKGRPNTMSAANDERRQVLNAHVIWDGSIERLDVFRNNVEGHYRKISSGYLFYTEFQITYLERRTDFHVVWMKYHQLKDAHVLYSAILSAFQGSEGSRILMQNRNRKMVFGHGII